MVKIITWETCLPAQNKTIIPGLNYLFVVLFVGGGVSFCPSPSLSLIYSAGAVHLLVSVQMNSFLPEQLLPGNGITDEENSCYPNSSLPSNLWYQSIVFSA